MSKKHSTVKSFTYAADGIKTTLKNEPNFKIHLFFASIAIIIAIYLGLSHIEFAILLLTIGIVLILELINTTLEALVDLVSPNIRGRAKIAKDVSAAAVLVSALIAVGIGAFLFLPKILK